MKTSVALTIILALIAVLALAVLALANARTFNFPILPKTSVSAVGRGRRTPPALATTTSTPPSGVVFGEKTKPRARLGVGARGQPLTT